MANPEAKTEAIYAVIQWKSKKNGSRAMKRFLFIEKRLNKAIPEQGLLLFNLVMVEIIKKK